MDKRRQGDTLVPCQHLGGRRQQVSTQPGLEEKISPNDWSYHLKLRDKQKPRKSPGKDRPFPSISRGGQQWPTPWCHSFQNLEAKKKKPSAEWVTWFVEFCCKSLGKIMTPLGGIWAWEELCSTAVPEFPRCKGGIVGTENHLPQRLRLVEVLRLSNQPSVSQQLLKKDRTGMTSNG